MTRNSTSCARSVRRISSASSCCGGTRALSSQLPLTAISGRRDLRDRPAERDRLGYALPGRHPPVLLAPRGRVIREPPRLTHARRPIGLLHGTKVALRPDLGEADHRDDVRLRDVAVVERSEELRHLL